MNVRSGKFTFGGRVSFVGVGGLATTTGFFLIITTGFERVVSSVVFFGSTDCSGMFARITGTVERGSPRRLIRTDFSAYSLT